MLKDKKKWLICYTITVWCVMAVIFSVYLAFDIKLAPFFTYEIILQTMRLSTFLSALIILLSLFVEKR